MGDCGLLFAYSQTNKFTVDNCVKRWQLLLTTTAAARQISLAISREESRRLDLLGIRPTVEGLQFISLRQ